MSTNVEFPPFQDDPFTYLDKLLRDIRLKISQFLKDSNSDISIEQYGVMNWIANAVDPSQQNVASGTNRDPAALTRMLDLLEDKGLVKRVSNAADRRTYTLQLSVDGNRLINRLEPSVEEIKAAYFSKLNPKDWEDLQRIFNKI